MASAPTCPQCGAALPRSALYCLRCGRPTYWSGRRLRRQRDAAVVGLAGSAVMASQSASMLAGGILGLYAVTREFAGDRSGAISLLGVAAVFVGFTLLFDLIGVLLLSGSFYLRSRVSGVDSSADAETRRRRLAFLGHMAALLLVLWVLVTLAWRVVVAVLVRFYPTPAGGDISAVLGSDLRRAAPIVLGLFVAAAFVLFLASYLGARFLQRARGVPMTFGRFLWPLETFVHFSAAVGFLVLAPSFLRGSPIELTALRAGQALVAIDFVLVPALGLLAYLFLFRDFYQGFRGARAPSSVPGVPTEAASGDAPGEA